MVGTMKLRAFPFASAMALAPLLLAPACGSSTESVFDGGTGTGTGDATTDGGTGTNDAGDGSPLTLPDSGSSSQDGGGGVVPTGDVDVVLTADNAYAFGYGSASALSKVTRAPATFSAAEIFSCPIGSATTSGGPEAWLVPSADAPGDAYLYVVAWADRSTTQGVLGQFKRATGAPIYTGNGAWEACATGVELQIGTQGYADGPSLQTINGELTKCNAASGSKTETSAGWVNNTGAVTPGAVGTLVFGEDNSAAGGDFPITCQMDATGKQGIDAQAKWMWYSPDGQNAFRYVGPGNQTRTFLIFRLPAKAIPGGEK
jgi:hypothetical protein